VSPSVRRRKRSCDGAILATVAAVVDHDRDIGVNGPADHQIDYVAGSDPGCHEEAEEDVACGGVAEVFEAFRGLCRKSVGLQWVIRESLTGKKRSTTSIMHRMRLATLVWWYP